MRRMVPAIAVFVLSLTITEPVFAATLKTGKVVSDDSYNTVVNTVNEEKTTLNKRVNSLNSKNYKFSKEELPVVKEELLKEKDTLINNKKQLESEIAALKKIEYKEFKEKETLVNNLKTTIDRLEKEYNTRLAKYNKGSFGFFEYMRDRSTGNAKTDAINALTALRTAKFKNDTVQGKDTDATDLKNMKDSLAFIREGNQIRLSDSRAKKNGCKALRVTHTLMAIAQSNTNRATKHFVHCKQFGVGENISEGYAKPFKQWYNVQKDMLDIGQAASIKKYGSYHVDHYINLIQGGYVATGFAINTDRNSDNCYRTHGQVFKLDKVENSKTLLNFIPKGGKYYLYAGLTVDGYEKAFNIYYNLVDPSGVEEQLESKRKELSKTEKQLNTLRKEKETNEDTLESKERKLNKINNRIKEIDVRTSKIKENVKKENSELRKAVKEKLGLEYELKTKKETLNFLKNATVDKLVSTPVPDPEYENLNTSVKKMLRSKTGWVKEEGSFRYYDKKTGEYYKGWHRMGKAEGEKTEHWSYFGEDGLIRTDWQAMGNGTLNSYGEATESHLSYFGDNGWLATGWKKIKGHWYYFGSNGWRREGWVRLGKGTTEPDGNSAVHWSFFDKGNGRLLIGLQTLNSWDGEDKQHQSFFDGKGWLVTNKDITIDNDKFKADWRGWLKQITK